MIIGIPAEHPVLKGLAEKRVALSPAGVREIVDLGSTVYLTSGAGNGAGFRDEEFRSAGAQIVYSNEETIRRSDLVLQVGRPHRDEWSFYKQGATVLGFLHLAVAPAELIQLLLDKKLLALGYELIQEQDNSLPVLRSSSEISGKMAVQIAGRLLESTSGGRGVLLGGIPGIPPADVVILGGGTCGYYSARSFLGIGTSVYILDRDHARLRELDELFQGRVVTALSTRSNIEKYVAFADVLIGAVLEAGRRAPVLVTREMVESMAPGSLIIDFSIDQGGCVETSTLTPTEDFLFTVGKVTHFCAPNVPAMVARTSSHALTNALLPYLKTIVRKEIKAALNETYPLRQAVYCWDGFLSQRLAISGFPQTDLDRLLTERQDDDPVG